MMSNSLVLASDLLYLGPTGLQEQLPSCVVMKMLNDPTPQQSISVNNMELNSVQKLDNPSDVDQPKRDVKIFPEDFNDSKCHKKYVDSLPVEPNNGFLIMGPQGKDYYGDVKETQIDTGLDNVADPSAMCLSKTKAHKCCRETDGSSIKDICIEEGVPLKDKILVEDGLKHTGEDIHSATDKEYDSKNEEVDVDWPVPVCLKSMTAEACEKDVKSCESEVLIHPSVSKSEATDLVLSDIPKEDFTDTLSVKNTDANEQQLKTSIKNRCKDEQEIEHENSVTESQDADGKLTCPSSAPETSADDSQLETSVVKTEPAPEASNKSSITAAVNNNNEVELSLSANHFQLPDTTLMPQQKMMAPDHFTASAPLQRDHFESSFASVGHHAGSITYSGSIAHSGSVSHRSDASSASTRSFAFPVLQNEWNFSPVRMQKADRRHLKRHRGWKHGLLCCKF